MAGATILSCRHPDHNAYAVRHRILLHMSGTSLRSLSRIISYLCFTFGVLAILFTIASIPNVFGMGFFFIVTCACIGAGIYIREQVADAVAKKGV